MSEFKVLLNKMVELLLLQQKIKTKEEFLDKFKPYLDDYVDIKDKLHNHLIEQENSIRESTNIYKEAMIQRDKDAQEFCLDKNSDELKQFLANQYVPYNSWKSANHDELVKLVLEVYDE